MEYTGSCESSEQRTPTIVRRAGQFLEHRRSLLVILGLAALLRLYSLDLIDFRFDEASAPQYALAISQGQWFAIAPFSGSVANHPPIYLYTMALPYLFTRDILVVAAYRVLLDVAAIALLWFLCMRYFNNRIAVIATLLFAVAPWAIQFARKLWLAPVPLFSVLLLLGLLEVTQRRNPWGWAIVGWGVALTVGTHLTAIYLLPAVMVVLVCCWRTLRPIPVLFGLMPILLIGLVYVQFDMSHSWMNINALATAFGASGVVTDDALRFALWISGGMNLSDLTDGAYAFWRAQAPEALNVIDIAQVGYFICSAVFVVMLVIRYIYKREWSKTATFLMLAVWSSAPVLLQLRHARPLQLHYLTPLYPMPFLFMALPIDTILNNVTRVNRLTAYRLMQGAFTIFIGLVVVWQVFTTLRFTEFIENYDTSRGGYGLPIRSALDATQELRSPTCDIPGCALYGARRDTIVVTPGGDPLVNEQATVMNVVLAGVPHRFADANAGIIVRPDTSLYIFTPGTDRAMAILSSYLDPGNVFTRSIPLRSGSSDHYIYARVAEPLAHSFLPVEQAQWDNGIQIIGYDVQQGPILKLRLFLQVNETPPSGLDYHWYNHLLVNGQKVAQADGGGIHPSNWRKGDVLIQWFDIPLPEPMPAGMLSVKIGSYMYPSLATVPVTLPSGLVQDGITLAIH